jgi:tagatose-6-phosphate ketose/aldose isomerase
MAALGEDTLFVCFLSGNRRVQQYERDLLEEIGSKRLVRTRVVVSGSGAPPMNPYAEHCLAPAGSLAVADDYRPAVDVIFGQLLGLFFSLRWKLQPDCPSPTGAISRVVQNVGIHS